MSSVRPDLRQAIRTLRSQHTISAVAVLSLALGMAPTSAVFSVIDAVGYRPLPIPDAATLVGVYTAQAGEPFGATSYQDYLAIRDETSAFRQVAASARNAVGLSGDGVPPSVEVASSVSGNYFSTLGLRPALGRLLDEEDDAGAGKAAAVISHRLWVRRYGRDPNIVGRMVTVNHTLCAIVGVAPEEFAGTTPVLAPDVWTTIALLDTLLPARPAATREPRDRRSYSVLGRLREDATLGQARAEAAVLGQRLESSYPETNRGRALAVEFEQTVRRRMPAALGAVALGIIAVVLLTACANVAGLLLGRGEARRTEIAVRHALGATRWHILRQLLVEGAVLALVAAALSVLIADWLVRLIPALLPSLPIAINLDLRLDARVLIFTVLMALVAVPVFAAAPALLASRHDVSPLLKGEVARVGLLRGFTLRNALVVGQIAVSLVMLVASGLLTRSLLASRGVDPGFARRPMLFATMAPPIVGYSEAQTREFYRRLLDQLHATPGVERASLARHVPLNSLYGGGATRRIEVPGYQPPPGQDGMRVRYNVVGSGFLATMGTLVVAGREFTDRDTAVAPAVVMVNQRLAAEFWRGADPVGRRLGLVGEDGARRDAVVVGIVQNAKYVSLHEQLEPYLYLPHAQHFHGEMTVVVRVAADERTMVAPFRRAIEAVDPSMPTLQITTLPEHLRMALFVERVTAVGVAVLGGLGLFLSMIGLHGVVAYQVARRRREIGIRMAVGADATRIKTEVLRQSGRLVAAGTVIGLGLALAVTRTLAARTYGVSALDPVSLGIGVLAVTAVSLTATWLPAHRASRLDPVATLREQ
ncbi:MAG: ABC transporter permease [Acidobacteriota bacterium]